MKNYGALKSIPKNTMINGQPHQLSYINPEEAAMLKRMGGSGRNVNGIPAYDWSWSESSFNPSNWGGNNTNSAPAASSNNNDDDDKGAIETFFDNIVEVGSNVISGTVDFVSDVGQAAADTVVEIATLGTADTETYNEDKYNLNYDATGGNTTTATTTSATQVFYDINGVAHATQAAADAASAAIRASGVEAVNPYKEYADSMLEANMLSLGGKQMPDEPDNQGNTPILQYTGTGSDGEASYTVVGGLDPSQEASMSTNADGTLFVPYDGQDPATINADTNFYGSTDPNAADYNMSKDLAQTGSYVDLSGNTVTGEAFTTDLPVNGAAILNEIGKDHLLKTGDDSKMITVAEGGGYQYLDGTKITNEGFEVVVNEAIADGIIDEYVGGGGDDIVIGGGGGGGGVGVFDDSPITRQVRGTRDIMGDFYGGQSGGLWNRFQNSYLTRFNQPTQGIDEMVRVVEAEDGTKLYYGADGALLNPDAVGQIRTSGDPTSLKIGEEDVLLGTQTLNPDGTVKDTTYTDLYDPEVDAGLFNYQ